MVISYVAILVQTGPLHRVLHLLHTFKSVHTSVSRLFITIVTIIIVFD